MDGSLLGFPSVGLQIEAGICPVLTAHAVATGEVNCYSSTPLNVQLSGDDRPGGRNEGGRPLAPTSTCLVMCTFVSLTSALQIDNTIMYNDTIAIYSYLLVCASGVAPRMEVRSNR